MTINCPKNLTTKEKETVFKLRQIEKDGVTTHYTTITVTVAADTCANPDAIVAGCGQPGMANFAKGPRPACYQTKFENTCPDGYLRYDDGPKSVAGQTCYYCVKNTCPTSGYTLGATPDPAEGYLTEKTDADNNCYKIKPCESGSTDYQSVNDCGNKQHPEGWTYGYNGMSGALKCGYCNPKPCTGMGRTHKCTPGVTPVCNEAEKSCGYKDFVVEYEGDEGKISFNDKDCPTGSSTVKSTEKCKCPYSCYSN